MLEKDTFIDVILWDLQKISEHLFLRKHLSAAASVFALIVMMDKIRALKIDVNEEKMVII